MTFQSRQVCRTQVVARIWLAAVGYRANPLDQSSLMRVAVLHKTLVVGCAEPTPAALGRLVTTISLTRGADAGSENAAAQRITVL